jgi:two-component system CheB/CheR fusion protein
MAREGLRYKLTSALQSAVSTCEAVTTLGVLVKTNGHYTNVNLTVCPVTKGPDAITVGGRFATGAEESSLYLVILKEVAFDSYAGAPDWNSENVGAIPQLVSPALGINATSDSHSPNESSDQILLAEANAKIAALQEELQAKEEYLQSTYEELESSSEELKSSNEEMQSVNEELQSTNEELETSKEELQSVNEELATVNTELQTKVNDLSRLNNDMNNLLAGTDVGTVFVDHQLRILRFTPAASSIINLIASDVGRPVAHLVSNLVGYNSLVNDTQSVLDTLIRKELEVQTIDGRNFNLRIHPYRTLENIIEGAVITFIDITAIVRAREALRDSNELLRLAIVMRDARDAVIVKNLDGRIIAWNPGATRMYGWIESEALTMNVRDCIPPAESELEFSKMKQLSLDRVLQPYQTKRLTKSGEVVPISMIATALVDENDQLYAISTTERAIQEDAP